MPTGMLLYPRHFFCKMTQFNKLSQGWMVLKMLARKRAVIAKNRTVLERIVNVLMFLGRQGPPLRGHREIMTDSCIHVNTGNFVEALHLRPTTAGAFRKDN